MIDFKNVNLLFGKPVPVTDKVSLRVPTVYEVAFEPLYSQYTQPLMVSTRQMFSTIEEVDELEARFPNVWKMIFDEEGDAVLGQMMGAPSGTDLIINALSYWTGLKVESFQKLSNEKIVNKDVDWVIDYPTFEGIVDFLKKINNYEDDEDLIAPRDMSPNRQRLWMKFYNGRMKKRQSGRTIADKIVILQTISNSFIPIEDIGKMSIFQFNALYMANSEKESAEMQWDMRMSPKYDTGNGKLVTWQEKIKL